DTVFMNYDVKPGRPKQTGLLVSDLTELIRDNFRGKRVLFLADCCYSGGLAKAAEELGKDGFAAASVTSAGATVTSTVNWTFTQTVIDALTGEPLTDRDGDGTVTLGELAAEVRDAMRYLERQNSGSAHCGLSGSFALGKARRPTEPLDGTAGGYRVRDYVTAPDGGRRRPGRGAGVRDREVGVQFYDYSEERTR